MEDEPPDRLKLPHETPHWVESCPRFFITICCENRGVDSLTNAKAWTCILETSVIYREKKRWHPLLMLAMPDHLHGIFSFPEGSSMVRTIRDFKHAVAHFGGVAWQRDFFDHRLRNDAALETKWTYVLNNPVRAGLVRKPEHWPFVYVPSE